MLRTLTPFIIFITLILIVSCSKYEDGPAFSLLTKKYRITGLWSLKEQQNTDGTVNVDNGNIMLEIKKDNRAQLKISSSGLSISGTWNFTSKKKHLSLNFELNLPQSFGDFEIRRLTNKELWLKDTNGNVYKYDKKD